MLFSLNSPNGLRGEVPVHDLPTTWLNEQAASYVAKVADTGSSIVFDHPNLSIAAASAEHLLAMKLLAARASDAPDLRLLLSVLGVASMAEVETILERVFPGTTMSDRGRLMIEDLLAASTD